MKIVGRVKEQAILKQQVKSDKPEFIAVYGRRRVGKTFLIKEYFSNRTRNKNTKNSTPDHDNHLRCEAKRVLGACAVGGEEG
jgi:Cdc6-like AAA superfamily ATPase